MNPSQIETISELSPMQQAMLFHSLMAPGSGVYVLQMSLRLTGRLDFPAFERAWRSLVARHSILRTAFFWENLETPRQVVFREVALKIEHTSWRGRGKAEQRERLACFLAADRARGFELSEAPLLRLALFELGEDVHQLVWTQHHLVTDGWSQGLVLRELLQTYKAFIAGREPALPLAPGFHGYLAWLQRQDLGTAEAFWRRSLEGFSTPTFLAARDGRVEEPDGMEARRRDLALPRAVSAGLREVARRRRLTLNTLVQGGWALLLAQESGQDDVVFGATVAGRPADLPGVEAIVGPFLNTLPVRVEVGPEQRLQAWLSGFQARQAEARRHEHAPLVDVQRWSAVEPGVALFDHILVFENLALPEELANPFPGMEIVEESASALTNYPLNVIVLPGSELLFSLRWDGARYSTPEAVRLLERLARALTAFAEDGDPRLDEVPLLLPAERHQLLHEWSGLRASLPPEATLHDLFAARARVAPDAPALTWDGAALTYGELHRRSNQLAQWLLRQGVGPESRVGLCLERSPEMIVGILGVLKAGGAYVPLDPAAPPDRLAYMVADAGARLVVATESTAAVLPATVEPVLLDGQREELEVLPAEDLPSEVDATNLSYVIYTSGSTGQPKGTLVTHGNVLRLFAATLAWFGFGEQDVWTLFHSYAFDFSVWEIWGALLFGGRLVVVPREVSRAPGLFLDLLVRERVTVLNQTPSAFAQLAQADVERGGVATDLRWVIFGGEALDPASLAPWFDRHGHARPRLVNMYGITETTVHVTFRPLAAADARGERRSGLGVPIPDLSLALLGPGLRPVPIGVPGELVVGGAGLARGYLDRPALTAERFVPDPFGELGARLYRSGDLGRWLPQGEVEYLGRFDLQVKIRGFRIELGEIEAALAGFPGVREAVVMARADGMSSDKRLVAYVAGDAPAGELRRLLGERLPGYMVPAAFVLLDALPLTSNGKVDRRALPAPETSGSVGAWVAPSGPVEELLAGIWADVLGIERVDGRVGRDDDFFALGGHSLLATRVMSRLRAAFGVEMPLHELFEAPVLADLAARIETARRSGMAVPAPPLVPVPREGPLPLSFAQQRLWFIDQLEPGMPLYNIPVALRIEGPLDAGVLTLCLGEIVRRHEALRTVFAAPDGAPLQVIQAAEPFEMPMVDLSGLLPEPTRKALTLALVGEEAVRPFDLARDLMLRGVLLRLAAEEHVLALTLHHIASDGWSMGILVREVTALYPACAEGQPPPLPELPVQYADFAAWQRAWLQGATLEDEIAYWRRQLAGLPPLLELPTDRPRPAVRSSRGASRPVHLPAGLTRQAEALGRHEGATLFMVLLAGFQVLLARYSGQEDLAVGSPVAGRNRVETEGLIGFFVNTLVLRGDLRGSLPGGRAGAPSFCELLGRVRETALSAYLHQDLPFEKLVDELAPERSLAQTPLYQVMLALQNAPAGSLEVRDLRLWQMEGAGTTAQLDLTVSLAEHGGALVGTVEHATDLFDGATIDRFVRHFATLLSAAAASPELGVQDLPLLDTAERHHVLHEWNEHRSSPARCATVVEMFERQVEIAPEAPALFHPDRRLTYRQLDRWANRLANRLRRLGVGPESRVAVLAERSPELIAGMLGIFKAGGVYVPLDADYPQERLAFMLADCGAAVLLTQEGLAGRLPAHAPSTLVLDAPSAGLEAESDASPGLRIQADQLAYVIYTSGSTGRPKGVMVPHGALAGYTGTARRIYGVQPGDRVLQFCSISFDISLEEILPCLCGGAELVLRTQAMLESVAVFLDTCGQWAVTMMSLPTAWWHEITAQLGTGEAVLPTCLRLVVLGGERALPESLAVWRRHAPQRLRLINAYGLTESTIISTAVDLGVPSLAQARGEVSIGRVIPGTEICLFDRAGGLVPVGVAGELCVGGGLLARGYLNRPDVSAERFVPHPLTDLPGARLYRTGDLARALPDGELLFLGRLDHQVKIRGFRIELGEIEAALAALAGVREAVVVAREDRSGTASGGKQLVAYVAGDAGDAGLAADELRRSLRGRLPDYMVPADFVRLAALPLTPNGKVDRKALPAPEPAGMRESYMAPRTREEELLAALWAQVLRLPRVGVNENFFALGGDSILSVQIVARVRQAGLLCTVRQIFEHQTVAELARHVTAAGTAGAARPGQGPVAGEVPLTPIQRWFFAQGFADLHHFNQALLLEPREPLDPTALEHTMAALVAHHDALRLRFGRREPEGAAGGWRQENAAAEPVAPFHQIDLSRLPASRFREAFEPAAAALQAGFDLAAGPLTRLSLFQADAGQPGWLLWVTHHLVVDGVSWRVLLEDLEGAYRQAARGLRPTFPPKTTSFQEWAHRLTGHAGSEELARELEGWRETARATVPRLPADFPSAGDLVRDEAAVSFELTAEETSDLLQTVPSVYHTRVDDALLSALVRALAGWTGSPRLRVDLEGHGREPVLGDVDDLDISRTVGWFTSLYPVVLEAGDAGPGDALVSAKERLRAVPGRGIGYGLLRHLGDAGDGEPARLLAAGPAAEVSFNYLGQVDATLGELSLFRASRTSAGPTQSPRAHRSHRLDVGGLVADGRLRITLLYGSRVYRRETAERLAAAYAGALRELIQDGRDRKDEVFTPSDFPKAGLDARSFHKLAVLLSDLLESLAGGLGLTLKNVEDIYPLSPLQQGMLFHSLMAPGSGVYVNQVTCTLPADLDPRRFRQAWERLVERHGILRTAFLWEGLDAPLQVVRRSVSLPWQDLDWRGLPADEQQRRFEDLRHRDRQAPLPLTCAPLMRFSLIRLDGEIAFLWTSHHLLTDGWSLPLLVRELGAVHTALLEDREPALPPVRPFSDYITWLQKQDPSRAEPFWRGELAGLTAPTPLGIDHPAGIEGASGQAEHRSRVSREVTAELQALAARHRSTLQTVTLGAWAVLLSRYSGEEDVVFGSVVSGRPAALPGVETMIGMFINTVPVRVRAEDAEPLAPWLQRLQQQQIARQDFEHIALTQIQRWSEVPSGVPLFEALYVFENYPSAGDGGPGGLRIGNLLSLETTNYPITLVLGGGDRMSLMVTYDRARLDEDVVPRLLRHFATLLAGMAEGPQRCLRDLSLLSASERHQLQVEWNDAGPALEAMPPSPGVQELFAAEARRAPDAVAVVCGNAALTYAGLAARAGRLARDLRRLGAGPDVRVGLFVERSLDMIVGVLGILQAGAAYVPLDPAYPRERLAFLIEDARVPVLLTQERLRGSLPVSTAAVTLLLDAAQSEAGRESEEPLPDGPAPGHLAYVIYTSGSTGRPKGVMVHHRGLSNLAAAQVRLFGVRPGSRVLQFASLSFDASISEIAMALVSGATLVLGPPERRLSTEELTALLRDCTVATLPPAVLATLSPADLPGLETLVVAGEACPLELARAWSVGRRFFNAYGPTEATVCATARLVDGGGRLSIGRPIDQVEAWVLDSRGHPVPLGVAGELSLGGTGLARGYLHRPDQTAARFVPHPFAARPGERLYCTGDLVRRLPAGDLEFLGRLDHQVKIRGFRIEPGEIEAALAGLPGVREAIVVARADRLVAYVSGEVADEELRRLLGERLPDHMVPAAFVTLAALPLTPNGKVDRKALPELAWQSAGEGYVAPRTPVEDLLAGHWAELLGLERVGATDSFFDLGGHSLLATRVVSRLRGAFGVEMPLRDLFDAPVLADFAARVETALRAEAGLPAPPLLPVPREGPLPLSFAQQRLWFIDQLEPGSPLYNLPVALCVDGPLDPRVLALTLGEIERRHEVLRTVFAVVDGAPVQVIQPAAPFLLPVVDLSGLADRQAATLAQEEVARPFDLTRDRLLRGLLLRLAAEEHILLVTLHHIASDGWSMGILVREVATLYAVLAEDNEGRPSPLPELPVQYADFAVWQHSWLHGEVLEGEITFWRRQLAGLPPLLELPTDRPRPAAQSYRGATRPVHLPAALTRQAAALARREGATLFMVLLAAFQALLARTGGQDDLAVGSPVAGRNRMETEGLIGFFVNTLVLRGDLRGEPTFRELLGRVRETLLDAWRHQDVPFEKLVQELSPERSLGQTPLFQVMLVLQNVPAESLEIRDLRLRPMGGAGTTSKFDLTLALAEHEGCLLGTVEHATDLFDAVTIDRLTRRFERLLGMATATPDAPASALPPLEEAESWQILREWNDTRIEGLAEGCLHQDVAAQAARTPGAVAVELGTERWTYRRLVGSARRLARHLQTQGVGPDAIVGLCAERSPAMVAGMLAVLEAGGAYLPLDPSYPADRLAFMLDDAGARVLLIQESLRERVPVADRCVVPLDARWDAGEEMEEGLGVEVSPDHLAYVIYTSGSTGRPKGVMVPHRGAVNRLRWAQQVYRLGAGDAVLQKASFAFDFSVWECFAPLSAGARLVLAEPGRQGDGPYLVRLLREHRVTFVHFVPSMLAAFLGEEDVETCVSLRQVFAGGEVLTPELRDRALARLSRLPALLDNQYGPTEISIDTTRWVCAPGQGPHRVPIGRPIANSRLYVVGPELWPLPVDVAGELLVGGAGVTRGYLRRPALTAERFVPDPFSTEPGARLYRTGDRARWTRAGNLEFLGRLDQQVKVRGFRIELGEIEAELAGLPGVREAAVVAREDRAGSGDRRLVAYLTGDASPEELRRLLGERLPDYMVPAAFVTLAALPLTPNGKVDRKALPAPEWQSAGERDLAPRTPVEEVLAGIWAELLGLERVGVGGHFFELGGHSLLATRVMSRLRSVFGVEMPVRDLFAAPVLADLAARIETARGTGGATPAPPLVPVPPVSRQGPLPLSFAQQRLWFIDQLEPGSPLYNMPVALRVEGPLDAGVLALCLGEIVRRHEALRTVFATVDGAPVQVIQPAAPFLLPVVDLADLPEAVREAKALTLASEEAVRPFDLARGPLLRGVLLRLAEEDYVAALTLPHIASDGWSMGILVREVAAIYAAFAAGLPSPLAELPVQYADFAVWQRSWLHGEVLESEISFWRQQLAGLPPLLELPTDRPRPAVQSYRGASLPVHLPAAVARQAEALARHEGATLFMVLLAAFQALLARYSGQDDLAVGSPVAGRNRMETEDLIGFFINTLVLRGDLTGELSFRELLGWVRETALAAHLHQDVPFERLIQELAPERSLAHSPLFQVMLALQNAPAAELRVAGLTFSPVAAGSTTSKFDLTLTLGETPEGLAGGLEYAADLFDPATAERFVGHLAQLLTGAMAEPETPLSDLPFLSSAERERIVAEWNQRGALTYLGLCAHELFEGWVKETPEALALVDGERHLSYAELDRQANRLAHRLRVAGVTPEAIVGVHMGRSLELVIALLAVLKAGGTYLPLDPSLPEARRELMLRDSGAAALVTRSPLVSSLTSGTQYALIIVDNLPETEAEAPLAITVLPENLSYVIYTSGSTGAPKGVGVEHGAAATHFAGISREYGLCPGERVLQFGALGFDVSLEQILPTLGAGATLVLRNEELASPSALLPFLKSQGITVANLPTVYWQQALQEKPWTAVTGLIPLRLLIVGGEAMLPEAARRWMSLTEPLDFPKVRLLNAYGPTEAVITATRFEVPRSGSIGVSSVLLGRPLPGRTAYVLTRGGGLQPVGLPGELFLEGSWHAAI